MAVLRFHSRHEMIKWWTLSAGSEPLKAQPQPDFHSLMTADRHMTLDSALVKLHQTVTSGLALLAADAVDGAAAKLHILMTACSAQPITFTTTFA